MRKIFVCAAFVLAISITNYGCKSRSYNNASAAKSGGSGGQCEFSENPEFRVEAFRRELIKALNEAAQSTEHPDVKDRLADFLPSGMGTSANPVQEKQLFWHDDCELAGVIKNAENTPMVISSLENMGRFYGGVVLYGKDVFSEGFYRNRAQVIEIEPREYARRKFSNSSEFGDRDMWFEWKNGKYVRHWNGASRRIIENSFPQSGVVNLYRGTSEKYSSSDALLATPVGNYSAFGDLASIFMTPDRRGALKFAKPRLVRFPVDRDQLIALVEGTAGQSSAAGALQSAGFSGAKGNRLAYAGIEGIVEGDFSSSYMLKGYVEIAVFVKPSGPSADVLRSVVQECDVPTEHFSDDPFSAEGKLCNPL